MAKRPKPPYIEEVKRIGRLKVWLVDGKYIRDNIDEEFNNLGHHYNFSYIPKDELWIARENKPDEQNFFIKHLLVERELMAKGASKEEATDAADKAERGLRRRAGDVKAVTQKGKLLPDPNKVHEKLWRKLENGVSVWIVNGRLVRSIFDLNYTSGGHDHVYEFVPDNEVWIDNDIELQERPFILVHELHERNLMEKGMTYEEAHEKSSKLEHYLRDHPDELHDALTEEGWED